MLFSLKSRKKEEKKQEEKKQEEIRKKSAEMDDMDDDLDFDIDSPMKKDEAKAGRRFDAAADLISDFSTSELGDSQVPQAPPRSRKTAGWSDDISGRKSWLRKGSKHFTSKDSPKKEVVIDTPVNASDIPIIPDIDDMKEEELAADVAKAPSAPVNRIATYQELDSDLSKHAAFQSLDGIDLSLLTKRLLPEHLVRKDDQTPWVWDTLFADVSSHVNIALSEGDEEVIAVDKIANSLEKIL